MCWEQSSICLEVFNSECRTHDDKSQRIVLEAFDLLVLQALPLLVGKLTPCVGDSRQKTDRDVRVEGPLVSFIDDDD